MHDFVFTSAANFENLFVKFFSIFDREKTRLLLIKQQQSITLVFINIIMLTGFQGLKSEVFQTSISRSTITNSQICRQVGAVA